MHPLDVVGRRLGHRHARARREPVIDTIAGVVVRTSRPRRCRGRRRSTLKTPGGQELRHDLGHPAPSLAGVVSRRLEHHRVAGRQRRRELPDRHHHRVVPGRRPAAHDADRLAADERGEAAHVLARRLALRGRARRRRRSGSGRTIGGTSSSAVSAIGLPVFSHSTSTSPRTLGPRWRRRSAAAQRCRSLGVVSPQPSKRALGGLEGGVDVGLAGQRRRSRTPRPCVGLIRSLVRPSAAATRSPSDEVRDLRSLIGSPRDGNGRWGGRDVERGVAVEEADGLEPEGDGVHRHHRPVLRARDVVDAEDVPEHDVGVLDRAILRGPGAAGRGPPGSGRRTRRTASAPPRRNGVTHSVWPITWARRRTGELRVHHRREAPPGTSL